MNNEKKNPEIIKTRAFTLLEVLIATAIFAVAMVLAGGIVAQTVRYQNKINNIRLVANESQRLSDLLSRDIKLASVSGSVKAKFETDYVTYDYKNGLALFNCDADIGECSPMHFQSSTGLNRGKGYDPSLYNDLNANDYKANTLVIFYLNRATNETNHQIYYFDNINKKIYLYSGTCGDVQLSTLSTPGDLYPDTIVSSTNLISSDETSDSIKFGGFAPYDSSTDNYYYQPYILFDINIETLNYDSTAETSAKAKTEIRTGEAGRSYNL